MLCSVSRPLFSYRASGPGWGAVESVDSTSGSGQKVTVLPGGFMEHFMISNGVPGSDVEQAVSRGEAIWEVLAGAHNYYTGGKTGVYSAY